VVLDHTLTRKREKRLIEREIVIYVKRVLRALIFSQEDRSLKLNQSVHWNLLPMVSPAINKTSCKTVQVPFCNPAEDYEVVKAQFNIAA